MHVILKNPHRHQNQIGTDCPRWLLLMTLLEEVSHQIFALKSMDYTCDREAPIHRYRAPIPSLAAQNTHSY